MEIVSSGSLEVFLLSQMLLKERVGSNDNKGAAMQCREPTTKEVLEGFLVLAYLMVTFVLYTNRQ